MDGWGSDVEENPDADLEVDVVGSAARQPGIEARREMVRAQAEVLPQEVDGAASPRRRQQVLLRQGYTPAPRRMATTPSLLTLRAGTHVGRGLYNCNNALRQHRGGRSNCIYAYAAGGVGNSACMPYAYTADGNMTSGLRCRQWWLLGLRVRLPGHRATVGAAPGLQLLRGQRGPSAAPTATTAPSRSAATTAPPRRRARSRAACTITLPPPVNPSGGATGTNCVAVVAATAAIFPRDRPVVDDDFATVGGDHYNVVFDYATMGDGCFNMVVDMRHRGRRLPRRGGRQLHHHGRLHGQLQCRLRVGRRRRRWCSTTTPLPPPSTAGRPAACTATRPPQRRQPQQRPSLPLRRQRRPVQHGYGEDGFGTIASDTVYGCAATIGGSTYTTDEQLVQQRPHRLLDVRRWLHQPGRTAPRSPAAAPTATGTPVTLQSARATPPLCTVRWRRYRGRGASSMVQ